MTAFPTKLPDNPVGNAAFNELRRYGVDTSASCGAARALGIYYFEKGNDTASKRAFSTTGPGSALAKASATEFDWEALLSGIDIFFFSGVTPAISPAVEQAVSNALNYCHDHGITVICDLNYRAKMWSRGESPVRHERTDAVCRSLHCQR